MYVPVLTVPVVQTNVIDVSLTEIATAIEPHDFLQIIDSASLIDTFVLVDVSMGHFDVAQVGDTFTANIDVTPPTPQSNDESGDAVDTYAAVLQTSGTNHSEQSIGRDSFVAYTL